MPHVVPSEIGMRSRESWRLIVSFTIPEHIQIVLEPHQRVTSLKIFVHSRIKNFPTARCIPLFVAVWLSPDCDPSRLHYKLLCRWYDILSSRRYILCFTIETTFFCFHCYVPWCHDMPSPRIIFNGTQAHIINSPIYILVFTSCKTYHLAKKEQSQALLVIVGTGCVWLARRPGCQPDIDI